MSGGPATRAARFWAGVAALVMVAATVAGCGASDARAAPDAAGPNSWDATAGPDPCRALHADEVTRVTARQSSEGRTLESWPPLCQFGLAGTPKVFVYLTDDERVTAGAEFQQQRSDSKSTQAVTGIGDSAYWLPDYAALHVLSGATHLTVSFGGQPLPPTVKNMAVALARLALPRVTASG